MNFSWDTSRALRAQYGLGSQVRRPLSPADQLRLAVAAYLARFKCSSREHRIRPACYLIWCTERLLEALAARQPTLSCRSGRMQEIHWFKPAWVRLRSRTPGPGTLICRAGRIYCEVPAGICQGPALLW